MSFFLGLEKIAGKYFYKKRTLAEIVSKTKKSPFRMSLLASGLLGRAKYQRTPAKISSAQKHLLAHLKNIRGPSSQRHFLGTLASRHAPYKSPASRKLTRTELKERAAKALGKVTKK